MCLFMCQTVCLSQNTTLTPVTKGQNTMHDKEDMNTKGTLSVTKQKNITTCPEDQSFTSDIRKRLYFFRCFLIQYSWLSIASIYGKQQIYSLY